MNIEVKNFKIFEKNQIFEIRPLTLVVGPNNTGKSALGKLLQLLKHGTFKLDFKKSGINSFEDIVNWNHPNDGFKFSFPAYTNYLPPLDVKLEYNDGRCQTLELTFDDEDEILTILEIKKIQNENYLLCFDYRWLVDCFFNDRLYYKNTLLTYKYLDINISEFRALPKYDVVKESLSSKKKIEEIFSKQLEILYKNDENLNSLSEGGLIYDYKFYTILPLFSLVDEIIKESNQQNYCLFEVFDQSENVTNLYQEKIIEIQDKIFSSIKINLTDEFIDGNSISNFIKDEIKKHFLKCTLGLDLIIKENRLFELIFEKEMLEVNYETLEDKYTLWSELLNQLFFLKDNLKRLYQSNVTRDITEDYVKNLHLALEKVGHRKNHYLNIIGDILKEIDLKGIDIDKTTIWITDENDRKIDIKNLGYGYSKLVPLILGLLELSVTDPYSLYNDIFIIEEPESNLHPDFQSKLAEIFAIISNNFLSVNLLVETHSEYLIRNLQYLIATNKADKNRSVIYYFNKDKYVSRSNPKVNKISIDSNGQLSSGFGKGFFDEAIKLQFKLSQLPFNNN